MRLSLLCGLAAAALALAAAAPSSAADAKPYTAKRTAWGDPDLRGTWPLDQIGQTPFQRPERFGDRGQLTDDEYAAAMKAAAQQAAGYEREEKAGKLGVAHWSERGNPLRQTSLIVEPANGRLPPMTPAGEAKAAAMRSSWDQKVFDSLADFNSLDRCITRGLPASMIPFPYNNGIRIWQSPGYVVMQLEIVHEIRIIPLDGRPPLPSSMKRWLGESRGHFEGSTLVIDTTNFTGQAPMNIVGPAGHPVPTSRAMHIVERLTPTGPDSIQYEARIEDPEVLTGPWKMSFPWTRNDGYQIFEYACHEGNTVVPNYIRGTSPRFAKDREDAAAARAQAEAAAKAKTGG